MAATIEDGEAGKTALHRFFRQVNRRKQIDSIYKLINDFAEQTFGDWETLVKEWIYMFTKPRASAKLRFTSMNTLLYLAIAADYARAQLINDAPTVEVLKKLHSEKKLLPAIHAMLNDGTLTLDDIDPPPEYVSE